MHVYQNMRGNNLTLIFNELSMQLPCHYTHIIKPQGQKSSPFFAHEKMPHVLDHVNWCKWNETLMIIQDFTTSTTVGDSLPVTVFKSLIRAWKNFVTKRFKNDKFASIWWPWLKRNRSNYWLWYFWLCSDLHVLLASSVAKSSLKIKLFQWVKILKNLGDGSSLWMRLSRPCTKVECMESLLNVINKLIFWKWSMVHLYPVV